MNNYPYQATIIGHDSVPRGRGKLMFLKHLVKEMESGQAIRLVLPASIPHSTIRAYWDKVARKTGKPHSQIHTNGANSYVVYLWVNELTRRALSID